ncbi:MAG: tetratricopeptide repeat protein [Rhizobiales bacterium]|nr:tetratricopeptide repeat protein [Hyphomicrobiales bacterium]
MKQGIFGSAFAATLAFLLTSASPASAAAQTDLEFELNSPSGNYLVGVFASKLRDTDIAAKYLGRALSDDPDNRNLVERAFILSLSSGYIDRAEALAERVVRYNKRHRMSHIVLGMREARKKRFESARKHFKQAGYTPVGELTSALLAAWSYAAQGKVTETFKALDALDKNDAFGNFKLFHGALIADFLGQPSRADQTYKQAYEQAGTTLRVVQSYGNYLHRAGRTDEASKVFKKYLNSSRRSPLVQVALDKLNNKESPGKFIASAAEGMAESMFSIASALSDEQNIDVSLIYVQLALSMRSDFDVARVLLGEIYEDTKRHAKAVETFQSVPATSPLKDNAEIQAAVNLDHLERTDEAIKALNAFIARNPKHFDANVTLGNIQRSHEKWEDAIVSYSRAIEVVPEIKENHWILMYFRGIAYERAKKWDLAEPDFLKALELKPDQPAVLNYLGYSWIEKGLNLKKAIGMVAKAVELRPNDGYIVDSLGWAHYQLGEFEDAVKHLERAVELRPEDPVINDHLGDAYWRVGRKLEAKFQWRHAKDNKPIEKDLKIIEEKLLKGMPDLEEPAPSANGSQPPSKS